MPKNSTYWSLAVWTKQPRVLMSIINTWSATDSTVTIIKPTSISAGFPLKEAKSISQQRVFSTMPMTPVERPRANIRA